MTDRIAQTVASGRCKYLYAKGEATPPSKFSYNAANSAKRNPMAPRGQWDSASQSVKPKGKGKKVQCIKTQVQDASAASPGPSDLDSVSMADVCTTNSPSLAHIIPRLFGSQNASPSQNHTRNQSSPPSLQLGLGHAGGNPVDQPGA